MKSVLVAVAILMAMPAFAAHNAKPDGLTLIHANELETMMKAKNTFVFDANTPETRKENGVIPGAKTLDNSHAYQASVLPTDKTASLVFYCANEQCMASHEAAKRAKELGYSHVAVMSDGIQGWKKAGKATQAFTN